MNSTCVLCKRLNSAKDDPDYVIEFEHSVLFFGEHQKHLGHVMLVLKNHHREFFHLDQKYALAFHLELMKVCQVLEKVIGPHKLNVESLGNVVPHVHWHIFPRFLDELHPKDPVWPHLNEGPRALNLKEKELLKAKILDGLKLT